MKNKPLYWIASGICALGQSGLVQAQVSETPNLNRIEPPSSSVRLFDDQALAALKCLNRTEVEISDLPDCPEKLAVPTAKDFDEAAEVEAIRARFGDHMKPSAGQQNDPRFKPELRVRAGSSEPFRPEAED